MDSHDAQSRRHSLSTMRRSSDTSSSADGQTPESSHPGEQTPLTSHEDHDPAEQHEILANIVDDLPDSPGHSMMGGSTTGAAASQFLLRPSDDFSDLGRPRRHARSANIFNQTDPNMLDECQQKKRDRSKLPQSPCDWNDYRKISAPPFVQKHEKNVHFTSMDEVVDDGTDQWSLAAQRLYATIASQGQYTSEHAIELMLKEVGSHADKEYTVDELLEKIHLNKEEAAAEELRVHPPPVKYSVSSRKSEQTFRELDEEEQEDLEEEQRLKDEEEGLGKVGGQLAAVARLISLGGAPAVENLSQIFTSHVTESHMTAAVEFAVKKLQEQWRGLMYGLFPVRHLQTMLLICAVQLVSVDRIIQTMPILFCYAAFIAMVYSTFRMFQNRQTVRDLEVWLRLLKIFGTVPNRPTDFRDRAGSISSNTDSERVASESFYSWNSIEPYVYFFVSLLFFVISFGLCGKNLPNCFLLGGISLFFMLFCFVALTDKFDSIALASLALNFLSHMPALQRKHRWARMAIFGNLLTARIGYVNFNIGFSSLALCLVPALYAITVRFSRQDVYKVLVPQLVCLAWSETAITLFLAGTLKLEWTNILLTAGVISLIFWPSGAGLALVFGVAMAELHESMNLFGILKALVTLLVLCLPFIYKKAKAEFMKRYGSQTSIDVMSPQQKQARILLLFVFYVTLVLMAITLLYHGSLGTTSMQKDITNLTWAKFEKHCGSSKRSSDNQVVDQRLCAELKGTAIKWKGAVQSVRISKVDNSLEQLLDYLPNALSHWVRCFYGRSKRDETGIHEKWQLQPKVCSLSAHHMYTFELETVGPWGEQMLSSTKGNVVLTAGHVFEDIMELLVEGDVIRFIAYFDQYPVVRYPPRMRLLRLECETCKKVVLQEKTAEYDKYSEKKRKLIVSDHSPYSGFWSRLFYAFKFLFNFILAPLFYIPT